MGELRETLRQEDHPERLALLAHLLREARPSEVWAFTSPAVVQREGPRLAPRLGRHRAFWHWLLSSWRALGLL